MPEKDVKNGIGAAIVAAAERNYVDFKNSIETEVEDRFKSAIGDKVAEYEATMFGGKYEPEEAEEAEENLEDEEEVEEDESDAGEAEEEEAAEEEEPEVEETETEEEEPEEEEPEEDVEED